MLIYPPLCILLGFDTQSDRRDAGWLRSTTSHRWLAPAHAVSDAVGSSAVIVKLFRSVPAAAGGARRGLVFHERRRRVTARRTFRCRSSPLCFLVLCVVNSVAPLTPALLPVYAPIEERAGGGFHLGPAARYRGARPRHVGKDHHRPRPAAHSPPCWAPPRSVFVVVTGGLMLYVRFRRDGHRFLPPRADIGRLADDCQTASLFDHWARIRSLRLQAVLNLHSFDEDCDDRRAD